ncbi:MAG: glycosyltransferase family 2 protein [Lautropia sp.]
MKFSIVTCTWNSEPWIAESIGSVDAQRGVTVERVFVDGGSTDGTLERLERVPGDVKLLRNVGGGIARAMNAGVEAATGDVIAHLHSDDMYLGDGALARVARAFDDNPGAKWVYGRCASIIDGRIEENRHPLAPFSWRALVSRNIVPHPSTFIRRDFFLASGGFSPTLKYAMDYDLWLRLARESAPIQVADYLAAFRFHGASISTANPWASHSECLRVRLQHADRSPIVRLEHLARHAVRSLRLYQAIRRGEGVAGS